MILSPRSAAIAPDRGRDIPRQIAPERKGRASRLRISIAYRAETGTDRLRQLTTELLVFLRRGEAIAFASFDPSSIMS